MKLPKICFSLLILAGLLLLSGCGTPFEPITFVSGNLELIYHNTLSEEFADSIGKKSAETAKENRDSYIENAVAEIFAAYNREDPPAELEEKLTKAINHLYDAAKYEVTAAEETEQGYAVTVTAYPLLTYETVINSEDSITAMATATREQYLAGMSTVDITDASLTVFCDTLNTALKEPTYGEAVAVKLRVTKDDDGYYAINSEDLTQLEQIMLYNQNTEKTE